jgi:hypothetical protein
VRRLTHAFPLQREKYLLGIILVAGLIHGLLFIFLVPPWQHYDEPGHFEYAWLLANHPGMPSPDEYDQAMRRELAASMVEHNFFAGLGFHVDFFSQTEPVWIGISQTNDVPLYYELISLPLRLVRTSDITFQLYMGRLVSLLLYLVVILAAYGVTSELTKPGNLLRWLMPATIALLPGFADLMTSVNNDVGAAAFFSLYLWVGIRLMRRGFSWGRLLSLVILSVMCYFTKNTVAIALVLLVVPIVFTVLRGSRRRLAWALLVIFSLAVSITVISWNGAAAWYVNEMGVAIRRSLPQAPHGSYVLELTPSKQGPGRSWVTQPIFSPDANLSGKELTLGYWVWASEPVEITPPIILGDANPAPEPIYVTAEPEFHEASIKVSDTASNVAIELKSYNRRSGELVHVYYDGFVLVVGNYISAGQPQFDDASGVTGSWGGQPFTNLARNASFERGWPQFNPSLGVLISKALPYSMSQALTSLSDLNASRWYYDEAAVNLFRSFWAKFGWGHVILAGGKLYGLLASLSVLGLAGAILVLMRNWRIIPWDDVAFLGVASLGIWGAALVRGIYSVVGQDFIPAARYAYPVIIPTMLVFCIGWMGLFRVFCRRFHIPEKWLYVGYLAFFIVLVALSFWTILSYYQSLPA